MKVYGSKDCYKCKVLVDKLKSEQKEFEYIDITTLDRAQLTDLVKRKGTSLPIVEE